jgi:cytoskeletal protein CcmA (bactofilin family)
MFGNKPNEIATEAPTAAPAAPTRTRKNMNNQNKNDITAYLGPDVRIEGTLSFESSVLIEGQFKGKIISEHGQLTIGEKARVEGELSGGQITIRGHVEGSVNATERVHLADRGELIGDLTTPSLQMDESVTFEGSCKMNGGARKTEDNKRESFEPRKAREEEIVDAITSMS